MPLVRVDLIGKKSPAYLQALGDGIYRAMVETINVPEKDRFQIFNEHTESSLLFDSSYLGIERTDGIVIIQISLRRGRTTQQKQALYGRISEYLSREPGIRPEDIFINLVEVGPEDWSFGNGVAQYIG